MKDNKTTEEAMIELNDKIQDLKIEVYKWLHLHRILFFVLGLIKKIRVKLF